MLGGAVDEWTEDKHKLFCGICVHLVLVFDKNHYYTAALWAGKVSKRCECRLAGQGPSYASLYQAICLQHNNNIVVYLWRRTQTHGAIHMTKTVKTAHLRLLMRSPMRVPCAGFFRSIFIHMETECGMGHGSRYISSILSSLCLRSF